MNKLSFIFFAIAMMVSSNSFANGAGTPPPVIDSQISSTETSFIGARILHEGTEIYGGMPDTGIYEDDSQIYGFWQGDSLFFGAENPDTGNTVDGVAEFFWFESSIPKSSDFYVVVVKIKSSPNVVDDWNLAQEDNWLGEFMYDIKPSQYLEAIMADGGNAGAIRWDWSVPFQNYKWEPIKTIQIEQAYSAGYDASAGASANADPIDIAAGLVGGEFKEGGFLKDVNSDVNIQSKGYINSSYKVSSQYTVTLYKWEMVVMGGADNMAWNLIINKDGSAANDSAYHEYFIVIQAPQGQEVHMEGINIGASFRNDNPLWFDGWDSLSMTIQDITWVPPLDIECYVGDEPPASVCESKGVCSDSVVVCAKGEWLCVLPETKEDEEVSCDGLDKDCDGNVDENIFENCSTECGKGTSACVMGEFMQCDAPEPTKEVCDGLDNNCDGLIDNSEDCYPSIPDYWYDENEEDEWNDHEDTNSTNIDKLPDEPKDDTFVPDEQDERWNTSPPAPEAEGPTVIEIGTSGGGCTSSKSTAGSPIVIVAMMLIIIASLFIRRIFTFKNQGRNEKEEIGNK